MIFLMIHKFSGFYKYKGKNIHSSQADVAMGMGGVQSSSRHNFDKLSVHDRINYYAPPLFPDKENAGTVLL